MLLIKLGLTPKHWPEGLINYMLSTMGVTRAGAPTRIAGTRTNPHLPTLTCEHSQRVDR
jgi:hypothetical protein